MHGEECISNHGSYFNGLLSLLTAWGSKRSSTAPYVCHSFILRTMKMHGEECRSNHGSYFKGLLSLLTAWVPATTSFQIHFPFFVYWKHNITLIWHNCWGWTTDLFDMNLVKEYKLGGCQWRDLGFIVTGWYMPYFHLSTFVLSEQYGEGEISQVFIFVSA